MKVDSSFKALQQVYAQFPSLKANADKGALEAAATKVLGPAQTKALLAALVDQDTYLEARSAALKSLLEAPGLPGAHPVALSPEQQLRKEPALVEGGADVARVERSLAELHVDVSAAEVPGLAEWMNDGGSGDDSLAALEKLLLPVSHALPPIGKPANAA